MDYGPPSTPKDLERQKRQDDKRHKKERKEIERKALEGVMSLLGCSKEEAKEKLNEICNERLKEAIKEQKAPLRRRPSQISLLSQALAKRREGR